MQTYLCPQHFRGQDEIAMEGNSYGSKSLLSMSFVTQGAAASVFFDMIYSMYSIILKNTQEPNTQEKV